MHKGQALSEEHKAKLLKAILGKPKTDEHKAKIRLAHLGKKFSDETRSKMSAANKGRIFSEEHKNKIRLANLGKVYSEETLAKMRLAKTGHIVSQETRIKMSMAGKGRIYPPEFGANIRKRWQDPSYKAKMSAVQKNRIYPPEFGVKIRERWQDPDYRNKTTKAMRITQQNRRGEASIIWKRLWQNPEFRDRVVKARCLGMSIHPNKPETIIMNMLESICPNEFKFNGEGRLGIVLAGLVPDFVNINGKKQVIEIFGDYWHRRQNLKWHQTELGRVMAYNSVGWDCLIIWENELQTPDNVIDKITNFTKRNYFKRLVKASK